MGSDGENLNNGSKGVIGGEISRISERDSLGRYELGSERKENGNEENFNITIRSPI